MDIKRNKNGFIKVTKRRENSIKIQNCQKFSQNDQSFAKCRDKNGQIFKKMLKLPQNIFSKPVPKLDMNGGHKVLFFINIIQIFRGDVQ